ncbi:tRNA pseudouridine(55) synthase TruB [Patescibacteria group bacterium]|nr:tRNA pseudouridine(55) synthase TruB [Patescibacteria group bacterium]
MMNVKSLGQRPISLGLKVVDKKAGWTSHDVVAKIRGGLRRKYGKKIKVGHGGTLDPFATGVLLILIGEATRKFEEIKNWDKEYVLEIELGVETDTGDSTGVVVREEKVGKIDKASVEKVLKSFVGEFEQEIPKFSAKKIKGKKMYELARAGKKMAKQTKMVEISEIELLHMKVRNLHVRVVCGGGTYMRQLAVDVGKKLGVPAHAKNLRRTRVGEFTLS